MNRRHEDGLHLTVVNYLKIQYPHVLFRTDMGGVRLTRGVAMKSRRLQKDRAWPDLFIAAPNKVYHGMFLELKHEGARVYKRDGSLVADKHIREQARVLESLESLGYYAKFGIGFDNTKAQVDLYLNEPVTKTSREEF